MGRKIRKQDIMPSLTIQGKRQIIDDAIAVLGKARVESWVVSRNVSSLSYFKEHVRKFGPRYFRELFNLFKSQENR